MGKVKARGGGPRKRPLNWWIASTPCALKGVVGPAHLVALVDVDRGRLVGPGLQRWPPHPAIVGEFVDVEWERRGNGRPLTTLRCVSPELMQALRPWAAERRVRLVLGANSELTGLLEEIGEALADRVEPLEQGPGVPLGHEALWFRLGAEIDEAIHEVEALSDDLVVTEGPPALAGRVIGACLNGDGLSQVLVFRDVETLGRLVEPGEATQEPRPGATTGAAGPEPPDTLQLIPGPLLAWLDWADAIARGCAVYGPVPALLRETENGVYDAVVDDDAHLVSLAVLQVLAAVLANWDGDEPADVSAPIETVLGPVTVTWWRALAAAEAHGGA